MTKIDRRILKSQEAIKKAFIELLNEKPFDKITIQDISDRANVNRRTIYLHYLDKFDLLDKLIEEHINKLQEIFESLSETDIITAGQTIFEYFQNNYLFFSTMLVGGGAPYFRARYLEFSVKLLKGEVDTTEGKNKGLNEDIILRFVSAAYVELVEWWLKNGMPYPPRVMAEQVGELIERIL
ncbi:MAG: TetR/AcrR family transcriptional regulator [Bacillus sp. (in: firmicutes)]|uniref:TetR/AcrR family transcriptional regulator n=1 Tax=Priestia megaterium TaxID=1404 RepID=A0A6H1P5D8_PRIMG|nr:TetR/AcrR family transcriptional regulator C-terminal domain-containing protein [Priestia megaterium]QIZ08776.1 TetR/AcrR family transcriptional regulator [Priestia megaterium]